MVFEPRHIINGSLLRQFIGKHVSIVAKVDEISGTTIKANTTDNQAIRINYADDLNARPSDWIEIIGIPAGADAIKAKEVIQFPTGDEEFDAESHNMLVQFFNHCEDIYRQE